MKARDEQSWNRVGTLRDKVALVRCGDRVFGFEARYVRQVGFPDAVDAVEGERDPALPAHVGRGTLGDAPCSVWDLGVLLGLPPQERAVIALERPGGLVVFRCGEILAVETVPTASRRDLPPGTSAARPGLFKAAIVLGAETERPQVAYLLRASTMLTRQEIGRIHRDWGRATAHASR